MLEMRPVYTQYEREEYTKPFGYVPDERDIVVCARYPDRFVGMACVRAENERGEVRQERLEQDEFASEETRKAFGREIGADYMLSGVLNSVVDSQDAKAVVFYQVNMKLINLETNQIVWNGQKQIKKYVKHSKTRW